MENNSGSSLQTQLADVIEGILTDRVATKDAIVALEAIYQTLEQSMRDESYQQLSRPARAMRLKTLSSELKHQADTWHLVWCLYCNPAGPGGVGGCDVQDVGDQRTFRQLLADRVSSHPFLCRIASVVAWLESIADDDVAEQGAQRFADHDGVWIESRHQIGKGGLVTDLDPDAPSRQGKALHPENVKSEERIQARLWQLVRAGRIKDARELSRKIGRPWCFASLGGGGAFGPLPVGVSAARYDDEADEDQAVGDLAAETESGAGTRRALWKWVCFQVSEPQGGGGGLVPGWKFERAVYGVLSGNVAAVLPVCASWEDALWAYCRACLDVSTDESLGYFEQATVDVIGSDVLTGVLQRCGLIGSSAFNIRSGHAAVDGALSVALGGKWPAPVAVQQLPRTFEDIFEALRCSPDPTISTASGDPLHRVQQLLVTDNFSTLAAFLHGWLISQESLEGMETPYSSAVEEGMQRRVSSAGGAVEGEGGSELQGVSGLPGRHLRMVAFGAHLMLLLEGLGVTASEEGRGMEPASGMREQVLVLYLAGLLEEQQHLELVPHYLPLLGVPNRELIASELLQLLTSRLVSLQQTVGGAEADAGVEADVLCCRMYCLMASKCQACVIRQDLLDEQEAREASSGMVVSEDAEVLNINKLATCIRPDEVRILLGSFMDTVRFSAAYAPLQRAKAARWLSYPLLHPNAATAASSYSSMWGSSDLFTSEGLPESWACDDALKLACALSGELALGDEGCAAAGYHLVSQVLPQGVVSMVQQLAAQIQDAALEDSPTMEEGEGVMTAATAARSIASKLESLAAEFNQWVVYYNVDSELHAWSQRYEAYQGREVSEGSAALSSIRQELASTARKLLQSVAEELLHADWLGWLGNWSQAEEEEEEGDGPLGIELTLTCKEQCDESAPLGGASYPHLKGAALFEFETDIRSVVESSVAVAGGDISAAVTSSQDLDGFVMVQLTCKRAEQSWTQMVELAVGLLQGSLLGVPSNIFLVNLRAGRSSSAAVCRKVCLGKMILGCSKLRRSLVHLGGHGNDGEQILDLLAGGGQDAGLVEVLSKPMLQKFLEMEADTSIGILYKRQKENV
ncbi:hypothetical protein CEUSTIGMA_g10926.t1 [Chlamydomonas eustigma]|uniref:Nuclear pore complex protein n=1 Tax=Chlamydomonas eustigma TaxID=1157962 RepID=A0A250XK86_9CHLO|nr:hypothetical protein CEUSTIGMA_g10926.t1 [Chlamydomonas eustigma]|eukprot:GAX83501.1 hypothetical protein CEUSTIGMA_g10926.t1 [Chlamydomonas eustigma]